MRKAEIRDEIEDTFATYPIACGEYIRACQVWAMPAEIGSELCQEGNLVRYEILAYLEKQASDERWPEHIRTLVRAFVAPMTDIELGQFFGDLGKSAL
jgi:hypothetical protein